MRFFRFMISASEEAARQGVGLRPMSETGQHDPAEQPTIARQSKSTAPKDAPHTAPRAGTRYQEVRGESSRQGSRGARCRACEECVYFVNSVRSTVSPIFL